MTASQPAMRRLPGVRVDAALPPAVDALPRMDVAAFVGFASTGPLHLPVVVESVAQYAAVFGADAPLAWDAVVGRTVTAHLGPCVRAFFANGGRRCWVVRVAGAAALTRQFAIPGVLAWQPGGGSVTAALADARCEGAWADALRTSTALESRGIAIAGLTVTGTVASFDALQALQAGDLLQLGRADEGDCAFLQVRSSAGGRVLADLGPAFERWQPGAFDGPMAGFADCAGFASDAPATWLEGAVQLDGGLPAGLVPGHWLRWTGGGAVCWLRIDSIAGTTVTGPAWRELSAGLLPPGLGADGRAAVLRWTLRVGDHASIDTRLAGAALAQQQPDATWFLPRDGLNAVPMNDEHARCPLVPAAGSGLAVPLGVDAVFGSALPPLPAPGTALERDGLADFGAHLFVDAELASDAVADLLAHAEDIRVLRAAPRPLRGLHAVLGIGAAGLFNEVSLLALPDAVHLGWQRRTGTGTGDALPPVADPVPAQWLAHRGGCAPPADDVALAGPDFGRFIDCATRLLTAPLLAGPLLPVDLGTYTLTWTDSEPGARYRLQRAAMPDFADAVDLQNTSALQWLQMADRESTWHYRVRAELGDDRSAWSAPLTVTVRSSDWVQLDTDTADATTAPHWLAVQRAALRLAAASGDLFVVLGMPRHARSAQAVRHAAALQTLAPPGAAGDATTGVAPLFTTEAQALSHAALYFPWLQASADLALPPDGATVGVLAQRAWRRGAWVAPANEPLRDVLALTPDVSDADRQALQDAQVNLLRDDPRGFLALSSDTLALDAALRPINVRRLLILLRRLALRRGQSYVFEPSGPTLRRAVQRGFDTLLADLYQRGAFAGASREEAFRVVTDATVNTPGDGGAGRFVVELRVAPALPMRYLSVLLAQSGERLSVVEEL